MKKITAISAASAVALSGLAFAVPAQAATTATLSLPPTVTVYEGVHTNAPVAFSSSGFDWSAGGIISQDTFTAGCNTLPSYLSLAGNFYDGNLDSTPYFSEAGNEPSLSVIGDAPVGSAASYKVCVLLEDQKGNYANGSFTVQVGTDAPVVVPVDPPAPIDNSGPVVPVTPPVDPTPTPVDPTPVPPKPVVDGHHHDGDHDGDHNDKIKEVKKKIENKISEHANKLPEKAKADFNKILEQVKKAFSKFRF